MEYASNGKANAGLTLGIIGTALGGIANAGGLAGIIGGTPASRVADEGSRLVTQHDMDLYREIAQKDSQIAQLQAHMYTDQQVQGVQAQISTQAVWNATQTANIQCLQSQIAQLQGMTRLTIPNANVSPGWGAVVGPMPDVAEEALSVKSAAAGD